MALSQSAVSELLEAFRAGDGVDLIRESVRMVLQELIETEAAQVIGAARYERTATRTTERNGGRERVLSTQAGDVSLRIPKLRQGAFFPVILEPRRRIDQALHAVVMEAYVHGISTRSVDDLVQALGIDTGISKSEVSRICAGLDEAVSAFRARTLGHTEFPYVYLDATYLHVRDSPRTGAADLPGQVVSKAVVVATGITAAGGREVLGLAVGDSEEETFWRAFLTDLKTRGLAGVRLVISDQHAGLVAALRRCFQGAVHQRCRVHWTRKRSTWWFRSWCAMLWYGRFGGCVAGSGVAVRGAVAASERASAAAGVGERGTGSGTRRGARGGPCGRGQRDHGPARCDGTGGRRGSIAGRRSRRPGGGRHRAEQVAPGLVAALLALVEPDERGDPQSPLRWTTKSLR